MSSGFFAMLSRMKYISRWALMRNTERESLSEHSLETAVIAHALAVIGAERFGREVNADRVALLAVYHDVPEILTGDMPTPVKYYDPRLREVYGDVERQAGERLLLMLPEDMRTHYRTLLLTDENSLEHRLVKAADKLSALIKCIEERRAGNLEFSSAHKATEEALLGMGLPEVEEFMREFLPAYSMTVDEQESLGGKG